jgi:hypothetical protein
MREISAPTAVSLGRMFRLAIIHEYGDDNCRAQK